MHGCYFFPCTIYSVIKYSCLDPWIIIITRSVCIRPKGWTQCIFPRSQHTCLHIYWPKVNLCQVVVASSRFEHCSNHSRNFFVNVFFFKWPPVAILNVQKSLLTISDQYHNFYFSDFLQNGCRRPFWLPETHFRWHFWAFQINIKLFFKFDKMAAGVLGSNVLG